MNQEGQNGLPVTEAMVEEKKGFSLIWLLPLIALAIAGWLVYRSIAEAKIPVEIEFSTSEGIVEGKTEVRYKGFSIGLVDKVVMKPSLDGVIVTVLFEREVEAALTSDTEFWLVKPEVTLAGISGLDTLLSGNYIAVRPGEGEPTRYYEALPEPPPMDTAVPGLHLVLRSKQLNSVNVAAPVLYRQLQVGAITDVELTPGGDEVRISAHIQPEFAHLVNSNTHFWNASGIKFSGSLNGFKVDVGSFASIVAGGVAFHTPELSGTGGPVANGEEFELFERFEDAKVGTDITLLVPNGSGIIPDQTQIKWRGYPIGTVKELNLLEDRTTLKVSATLDPRAGAFINSGSIFYQVRPSLEIGAIRDVDAILSGSYIEVRLGEGEPQSEFLVLPQRPPLESNAPGLHLSLETQGRSTIQPGAPVSFRGIEVGSVQDVNLNQKGDKILVLIHILPDYEHLVSTETRFWSAGGINIQGGVSGFELRTESVLSMLVGGVAFENPAGSDTATAVKDGASFKLFDNFDAAQADLLRDSVDQSQPGLYPILETDVAGGVRVGSPVFHRNLDVGSVVGLKFDASGEKLLAYLRIEPKYAHLVKPQSRFWRSGGVELSGDLSGLKVRAESLLAIFAGGISFDSPAGARGEVRDGQRFILADDYEQAHERGLLVDIVFDDGVGLKSGTKVKYRGIEVGEVRKVTLLENLREVEAQIMLFEHAAALAREESRWWVVGPKIGLAATQNLDTLLTGVYITVQPGEGDKAYRFRALSAPPQVASSASGLDIVLTTPALNSIKQGNLVFYRKVPVGKVTGFELGQQADEVLVHLNIQPRYVNLVRENSRFWNASGFNMDVGIFSKTRIRTESMESILEGGIAFATPDQPADPVVPGHRFVLEQEQDDAWREWKPKIPLASPQ